MPGQGHSENHHGTPGGGFFDDTGGLILGLFQKPGLKKKIGTAVSGNGQLGKEYQIRSLFTGIDECMYNGIGIIPDGCWFNSRYCGGNPEISHIIHISILLSKRSDVKVYNPGVVELQLRSWIS
jgi:hypothetical protein